MSGLGSFSRANSKWQSSQRLVPEAMSQRSWQTRCTIAREPAHSQGDNRSPALLPSWQIRQNGSSAFKLKTETRVLTINSTTSENNNKITHYYRILKLNTYSLFNPIVIILMKIDSPSGHRRSGWVCFFIWTDFEKCSIISLAHRWIPSSEWVPSEWEPNSW